MEITTVTQEYMAKLFSQGKRFDGRALTDFRKLGIAHEISNKAEGSVRIKLGNTDVVVGVKLGLGAPYPDSPDKGNLMCTSELLPIASPKFESGPPNFRAIEVGRLVDRAMRESGMIDLTKLVITPGEKVWTIYIDIYPLNDDGNLIDVSTIGALLALKNAKMPSLDKDGNIDYSSKKGSLPLSKEIAPLSLSFYKLKDSIIIDPTREEEEVCEARVTFGISKWDKKFMLNSCQKAGSATFSKEEIDKIMDLMIPKYNELSENLKKLL